MKHVFRALCLWLLLIVTQQGAVVHELSHCYASDTASAHLEAGGAADRACALCPAFAQVTTPAFSHAFHIPALVRAEAGRFPDPAFEPIDTAVPTPRSRGPPLSS